jgi:hypothetical protein
MRSTGRSRRLSVTASSDRSNTGELEQDDWEIDLSASSYHRVRFSLRLPRLARSISQQSLRTSSVALLVAPTRIRAQPMFFRFFHRFSQFSQFRLVPLLPMTPRHLTMGVDGWIKMPLARLLPLQLTPKGTSSGAPEAGLASTVILHVCCFVPCSHSPPEILIFGHQRVGPDSGLHSDVSCCICRPPSCSRGSRNPSLVRGHQSISSCKQAAESHQTAVYRYDPWMATLAVAACKTAGALLCLEQEDNAYVIPGDLHEKVDDALVHRCWIPDRVRPAAARRLFPPCSALNGNLTLLSAGANRLRPTAQPHGVEETRCRSPCVAA